MFKTRLNSSSFKEYERRVKTSSLILHYLKGFLALEAWLTWGSRVDSGATLWAALSVWSACVLVVPPPACCLNSASNFTSFSSAWPPSTCTGCRTRARSTAATTVATAPALFPPPAWRHNQQHIDLRTSMAGRWDRDRKAELLVLFHLLFPRIKAGGVDFVALASVSLVNLWKIFMKMDVSTFSQGKISEFPGWRFNSATPSCLCQRHAHTNSASLSDNLVIDLIIDQNVILVQEDKDSGLYSVHESTFKDHKRWRPKLQEELQTDEYWLGNWLGSLLILLFCRNIFIFTGEEVEELLSFHMKLLLSPSLDHIQKIWTTSEGRVLLLCADKENRRPSQTGPVYFLVGLTLLGVFMFIKLSVSSYIVFDLWCLIKYIDVLNFRQDLCRKTVKTFFKSKHTERGHMTDLFVAMTTPSSNTFKQTNQNNMGVNMLYRSHSALVCSTSCWVSSSRVLVWPRRKQTIKPTWRHWIMYMFTWD